MCSTHIIYKEPRGFKLKGHIVPHIKSGTKEFLDLYPPLKSLYAYKVPNVITYNLSDIFKGTNLGGSDSSEATTCHLVTNQTT